jgi:mono/diheme cytochrome c family protein
MALPTFQRTCRTFPGAAFLLLGTFVVSGCDFDSDRYPADKQYPLRSDPLVLKLPDGVQPVGVESPGNLNTLPERIKENGGQILDPTSLPAKKSAELDAALKKAFGTPRVPEINGTVAESGEEITNALGIEKLNKGSRLYRRHCLHCHGLTGDGHGPTAPWVNPHPRDYRLGLFKFTSSSQIAGARKPRREDLLRTLRAGIEGTSMPSFALLPEDELDAIINYVIHLSMRGEVEFAIMKQMAGTQEDKSADEESMEETVNNQLSAVAANWVQAQSEDKRIKPGPYPTFTEEQLKESVRNGFKLFTDKQSAAGCVSCHGDFGRKNNYMFDPWGTIVRPIDLTSGVYRGGRRPVDLYYRIHSGIDKGMPGFSIHLDPKQTWDVVNFLQVLPYPKMREQYGINIDE